MKYIKPIVAILLLAVVGVGSALADRGLRHHHAPRVSLGISVGPLWNPWFYSPWPYYRHSYYYSPVISPVIVQTPRQIYVEQQGNAPAVVSSPPAGEAVPAAPAYWYYCNESQVYYPYVKECQGPWQKVPAQPPGQ